jgi:hypothetical protein
MPGVVGRKGAIKSCALMSNCNEDLNQTDEEIVFRDEVSDEALEAASVVPVGLPTLAYSTYCFACPSIISSKFTQQR